MDEKELMLPLELGYVQVAERNKCINIKLQVIIYVNQCIKGILIMFLFIYSLNIAGAEKQESNLWQGGPMARWPTMLLVGKS